MANPFQEDIEAAIEMIAEVGADCLWRKAPAVEEGDAPGYTTVGAAPDPIPCKIAFFRGKDVGYGGELFAQLMANSEVQMGAEVGLLAGGLGWTPDDEDTIQRGGDLLAITGIDRIAPNGIPILYFVKVA